MSKVFSGARFGKLTVVSRHLGIKWLCQCDCGKVKIVASHNLGTNTNSCGCIRNTQNGLTEAHPLWKRWSAMISRCTKSHDKDFPNYGGRGITVCDRWLHFPNFLTDMEPSYFRGATLDRKDNNAGYSPENCQWSTVKKNSNNRRNTRFIDSPWGKITFVEAAERMNISRDTFATRVRDGWPPEDLFNPSFSRKLHRFSGRSNL